MIKIASARLLNPRQYFNFFPLLFRVLTGSSPLVTEVISVGRKRKWYQPSSGSIHEKPTNYRKSAFSAVPFPKLYFIILSLLMKDLTFTHFFVPNCILGMLAAM